MFRCAEYPETPKRNVFREITNQPQGASPTANLRLLTTVALKSKDEPGQSSAHIHRKDKSLQKLCDRFLMLYPLHNKTTSDTEIHLDSTAQRLGVERRRIYDIINILEALQCATHCRKNTYKWHGATRLSDLLRDLKQQGEELDVRSALRGTKEAIPSPKQRSLGVLAQRFLMMFLVEPPEKRINLEMAIQVLINPQRSTYLDTPHQHDPQHKSKVRRLYDISNVLSSIGLIEKVTDSILKKPVFRYKGLNHIRKVSSTQKCGYQTPVARQQVKQHSTLNSKRKLEFSSPVIVSYSSVMDSPISPSPSLWNEILHVADQEYTRLNGASA